MRRTGRAAAGMVGASDDRLNRVFDITVMPAFDAERGADVTMIVGRDVTLATSMRRRITSYNVCYTKLLRLAPSSGSARKLSGWRPTSSSTE